MIWKKIKAFSSFAADKYSVFVERNVKHGDVKIFSEFLSSFLKEKHVNFQKLFEGICEKFQFEFLLLCELAKE